MTTRIPRIAAVAVLVLFAGIAPAVAEPARGVAGIAPRTLNKISVSRIAVSRTNVVQGTSFRVWFLAHNLCDHALRNVEWRIVCDSSRVVASGRIAELPAHGSVELSGVVSGSLVRDAGPRRLVARVDPQNTLGESYPGTLDNVTVKIVEIGPRPPAITTAGSDAFAHFVADARGHDWANAYLLAFASFHSYNLNIGAANNRQYRELAPGFFRAHGLECEFLTSHSLTTDTEIVLLWSPSVVIVVCRGTEGPNGFDWATDLNTDMIGLGNDIQVHRGFWYALADLYPRLKDRVAELGASRKVWTTGHSLGGALATLAAYRLRVDGVHVHNVYSYASPRVGNRSFRDDYHARCGDRRTQRWVNDHDLITGLPPASEGFRHVGQENHIVKIDGTIRVRLNTTESWGGMSPTDHSMIHYLRRIHGQLSESLKSVLPELPTE